MKKIEIIETKQTILLAEKWEELTYEQFLAAISLVLINKSLNGQSQLAVQVELVKHIIGFKESGKTFTEEQRNQIISNLAIMASSFDFMFKDGEPNFHFTKWMSPKFTVSNRTIKAPYFEIMATGAEVIMTNISAEQFADAWEYHNIYLSTNNTKNLRLLTAVLYQEAELYNPQRTAEVFGMLETIPEVEIYSIFLQFKSIIDYVQAHQAYGVLFRGGEPKANDSISLGFGGQIYAAASKGYGDINTIAKKPFPDFLALLLDMLINDVRTMKAYEMTVIEIAKKIKLPTETIKRLL